MTFRLKTGFNQCSEAGMRGTGLCAAIETRNFGITKFLLDAGCDINAQDFDGEPPLLLAIRKQSPGQICGKPACLDIVKLLVNHPKCNLNKVDPLTKKSALHFATEQDMAQVVGWLITSKSETECNINQVDANGNSPLHLAVLEGLTDVVEVLVNCPNCWVKVYNKAGLTPLHICARNGDSINMQRLLRRVSGLSEMSKLRKELEPELYIESELDLNLNAITVYEKETCLHIASRLGHKNVVELLLNHGAKVDLRDNLNNTPLLVTLSSTPHWQTKENSIPKMLLKKGANPNVKSGNLRCRYVEHNHEVTPLILAAKNNNLELAKILISSGADVNQTDNMGQSSLYIALWEEALPVANFLLRECPNVNINMQTDEGNSCLHALVKCRKNSNANTIRQIVKTIFQAGGQIYANKNNKTVLDKAFEYEDHVLFDAVLGELGCNIEDVEVLGGNGVPDDVPKVQRWIHKAVSEGMVDMLRVLLSHGADIDATYFDYDSRQSLSNLYIALYNTEYATAEYLVKNGIDLTNENYIFVESEKKDAEAINRDLNAENSDDESGSDDDDESGSDDDDSFASAEGDIFHGNEDFRKWLREIACTPRSLKLSCFVMIRKFFINYKIPFSKMQSLKLPLKITSELRYKS
ncbi:ankyrin-1-like [Mercenaria mercenaria]|uniref:ankyrin-1-like n=1 Tax=Mercenaria mercenaria TaxID=6596 RepID=UPI00234EAC51|nr:ankyrin-1-like [Mercenaria mercenaria]